MDDKEFYNQQRGYYLTFLENTDQKERTVEHMLDKLPEYEPSLSESITNGGYAKFLSIGSGSGEDFIPFIGELNTSKNIECSFHEPNLGVAILFFFNYLTHGLPFSRLSRYDNNGESSFTCSEPENYDFISASHVFYYIPDWEKSLEAVYDSLVPGGIACITMTSNEGPLYKIRKGLFPKLYDTNTKPKCAEGLCDVLDKLDISYKTEVIESKLDVTSCCEFDNEIGDNLASFFVRKPFKSLFGDEQFHDLHPIFTYTQRFQQMPGKERILHLLDKAIWIKKEGEYKPREKRLTGNPKKINLNDFKNFFKPIIDNYLEKDISFLDKDIKEAYTLILLMDSIVTHPLYSLAIGEYNNAKKIMDGWPDSYEFPEDLDPKKVILFDSDDTLSLEREFPYYKNYPGITIGYLPWFWQFIGKTYDNLPEKYLDPNTYCALIFDIYRVFKHYKVFSSNTNTALIGLEGNPYFNYPTLAKGGEKLSPELIEDKIKSFQDST